MGDAHFLGAADGRAAVLAGFAEQGDDKGLMRFSHVAQVFFERGIDRVVKGRTGELSVAIAKNDHQ